MQQPGMHQPGPLPSRGTRRAALHEGEHDVLVVGGGITGAGIALDLALRGLRVALVERGDWGGQTSSASSRLIHGGLRYLEQFEFGLVRDSCLERGLLLRNAAGLVWPESFVFPVHHGRGVGRAKLMAGLWLYTAVSVPRVLGRPRLLSRGAVQRSLPGVRPDDLRGGGSYLDGATDDARLTLAVVGTAMDAGAVALSRTEVRTIEKDPGPLGATAELRDLRTGETAEVRARAVVLAGGPFTDELRQRAGLEGRWVQPTRGTHVTVPRERLPTDGAVIFPSGVDGRIMFLIPWPRYTVIGTTDLDASPELPVRATRAEVRYLLESANELVPEAALTEADVVSSWAGLRPLLAANEADPSARSREERVEREGGLYTIAGGKLTGFRSMAEKLGARLCADLQKGDDSPRSPTRDRKLRGALAEPVARPAWSSLDPSGRPRFPEGEALEHAWTKRYGALKEAVVEACGRAEQGRLALDHETLLGEVDWAVRFEDCLTPVDFYFRRTDLGYGPRDAARANAPMVLERLAGLLAWDADTQARERQSLLEKLDEPHAWRAETPDAGL